MKGARGGAIPTGVFSFFSSSCATFEWAVRSATKELKDEGPMFQIHVAIRRGGTIELTSGVFAHDDAIAHIVAMSPASRLEADGMLRDACRLGMRMWSGTNCEVRAKLLVTDQSGDEQQICEGPPPGAMVQRA